MRGEPYIDLPREVDKSDPVVMRLVELFKSDEARRHIWRQTLIWSAILLLVVCTLAILSPNPLNWTPPSPRNHFLLTGNHSFGVGLIFFGFGSMFVVFGDYVGWALKTWAQREAARKEVKG